MLLHSRGELSAEYKLGDTRVLEKPNFYYLDPIIAVWQRHGVTRIPGGEGFIRVWEPDPLDICFCGGRSDLQNAANGYLTQLIGRGI